MLRVLGLRGGGEGAQGTGAEGGEGRSAQATIVAGGWGDNSVPASFPGSPRREPGNEAKSVLISPWGTLADPPSAASGLSTLPSLATCG